MNLPDIPGLFASLELLQPYHSHRAAPQVKRGFLGAEPKDLAEEGEVLSAIEKFGNGEAEGWACFAQELRVGIGNANLARDMGLLLSAEFVQRATGGRNAASLHVRLLGSHWRLTTITRSADDRRGFLVPHRYLSSRQAADSGAGTGALYLEYEVFWTSDDKSQPLRATLSRFTGFSNR